jgi:chaperonin cofactor prefoldin
MASTTSPPTEGVLLLKTELGEHWIHTKSSEGKLPCSLELYFSIKSERNENWIEFTQKLTKFDTREIRKKAVDAHYTNIKHVEEQLEELKSDLAAEEGRPEPDAKLIGNLYIKRNQLKTKLGNLENRQTLEYDDVEVHRTVKVYQGRPVVIKIIGLNDNGFNYQLLFVQWFTESEAKQQKSSKIAHCNLRGDPLDVEKKTETTTKESLILDKIFSKSLLM